MTIHENKMIRVINRNVDVKRKRRRQHHEKTMYPMFYENEEPFADPMSDYVHVDDLPDMDGIRYHMRRVFECLYGNRDVEDLDDELEEVCTALDMKLPTSKLTIRR